MTIEPVTGRASVIELAKLPASHRLEKAEAGFKDVFLQALQATSDLQKESGRLTKEFTLENPAVTLESTMIAGTKSGIAFQSTVTLRNKVMQAYSDIMNMPV